MRTGGIPPFLGAGLEIVTGGGHGAVAAYDVKAGRIVAAGHPPATKRSLLKVRSLWYDVAVAALGVGACAFRAPDQVARPMWYGGLFGLASDVTEFGVTGGFSNEAKFTGGGARPNVHEESGVDLPIEERPASKASWFPKARSRPRVGILG